jgi:hypothetical protein
VPWAPKPPEYDTRWVSSDPDICFEIGVKYDPFTYASNYGRMVLDSGTYEFSIVWRQSATVIFQDIEGYIRGKGIGVDKWLFEGPFRWSDGKLIVTIKTQYVELFDDSVKELVFVKDETYVPDDSIPESLREKATDETE